jgi:hypothetical protein
MASGYTLKTDFDHASDSRELAQLPTFDDNGWVDAAEDAGRRVLKGKLLKFADRRWTCGRPPQPIKDGTRLVALGVAQGWVFWQDGGPAGYRMKEPGKQLPERDTLGDTDESRWPKGPDGKPRDPFQETSFVYLADPTTAEMFTFSTASGGGRGAVAELAAQVARMQYARPGAKPLVELRSEDMPTRYGLKSKPFLKVVSWLGGAEPPAPKLVAGNPAKIAPNPDLDDDLPF